MPYFVQDSVLQIFANALLRIAFPLQDITNFLIFMAVKLWFSQMSVLLSIEFKLHGLTNALLRIAFKL